MNKISIYSIHYNRPDLIRYQYESIVKFVKDDFEFIVIDNSILPEISREMKNQCDILGVTYKYTNNQIPHGIMTYGWSHIHGLEFFKNDVINNPVSNILLIEHDVFLCSDFSKIRQILSNYALCGVKQEREHIEYVHPGIMYINKDLYDDLHNLDLRGDVRIDGVLNPDMGGISIDVGGRTYKYIINNRDKVLYIDQYVNKYLEEPDTNKHVFYHMVRGSNWIGTESELNVKKMSYVEKFLYEND
jgi:hypothetical protein